MRNRYLDYFLTPGIEYRGRLFINHNVNFLHRLQNNSVYRTCTVKISLAPPGLNESGKNSVGPAKAVSLQDRCPAVSVGHCRTHVLQWIKVFAITVSRKSEKSLITEKSISPPTYQMVRSLGNFKINSSILVI